MLFRVDQQFSLSLFLFLCLIPLFVNGNQLVNQTIDDINGDSVTRAQPVYGGSWNAFTSSNSQNTNIPLDGDQVFDGTWHNTVASGTSDRSITLNFTGVAIYVQFVLPDSPNGFKGFYQNFTFTLDDEPAKNFFHNSSGPDAASFQYNVTAFSKDGLKNDSHILVMEFPPYQGTPVEGLDFQNLILFDYAIYTQSFPDKQTSTTSQSNSQPTSNSQSQNDNNNNDNGDSSSSSSSKTGPIVGGILGALAVIAALGILAFFLLKRRRSRNAGGGNGGTSMDLNAEEGNPNSRRGYTYHATGTESPVMSQRVLSGVGVGTGTSGAVSSGGVGGRSDGGGSSLINPFSSTASMAAAGAGAGAAAAGAYATSSDGLSTDPHSVSGSGSAHSSDARPSTTFVVANATSPTFDNTNATANAAELAPQLLKLRRELEENEQRLHRSQEATDSTPAYYAAAPAAGPSGAQQTSPELMLVIERLRQQVESLEGRMEQAGMDDLPPTYQPN